MIKKRSIFTAAILVAAAGMIAPASGTIAMAANASSVALTNGSAKGAVFGKHNPHVIRSSRKRSNISFLGAGKRAKHSNKHFHARRTRRQHAKKSN